MIPDGSGGSFPRVRAPVRTRARIALSALAGLAVALLLMAGGFSDSLDRPFHDLQARLQAGSGTDVPPGSSPAGAGPVGLVYVDQPSLDWAEAELGLSWPWPRETYGIIADFCGVADAIAFDILFTERSPFGSEDDARFLDAVRAYGRAILADSPGSVPVYRDSGVEFGSVGAEPDSDGVLRRYAPSGSLGQATALRAGITAGPAAPRSVPDRVILRFRGRSPAFRTWSAASILAAAMAERQVGARASGGSPDAATLPARGDFSGMTLFVGLSAPGLMDLVATPVDPAMPGAEVHATFLDNAIAGNFLTAPGPFAALLVCLLAASGASLALRRLKRPFAQAAGTLASIAMAPAAAFALYPAGILMPVAAPMAAALGSALAGLSLAYQAEGRQRAWLRKAFGQYLSHEVIETLLHEPARLGLGGERRRVSVMFTDVQGFTALSERLTPEALTSFMNRYLGIVTQVILDHGGTVDKYIGDAVVAFWNAPLEQPDHARRAVGAARGIRQALSRAAEEFDREWGARAVTRIGVHSGDAVVGNMGSPFRFAYTALGDAVNLASRLEGANKALGTLVLVSGETIAACGETPEGFARLGLLKVAGRETPCEVWSPDECESWEGLLVLDSK